MKRIRPLRNERTKEAELVITVCLTISTFISLKLIRVHSNSKRCLPLGSIQSWLVVCFLNHFSNFIWLTSFAPFGRRGVISPTIIRGDNCSRNKHCLSTETCFILSKTSINVVVVHQIHIFSCPIVCQFAMV